MAKAPSDDASQAGERTPVLAYLRVSTDEQGRSGLGLGDQRGAIQRAADYKGWHVVEWIEDTASGKDLERSGMDRRPKAYRRRREGVRARRREAGPPVPFCARLPYVGGTREG